MPPESPPEELSGADTGDESTATEKSAPDESAALVSLELEDWSAAIASDAGGSGDGVGVSSGSAGGAVSSIAADESDDDVSDGDESNCDESVVLESTDDWSGWLLPWSDTASRKSESRSMKPLAWGVTSTAAPVPLESAIELPGSGMGAFCRPLGAFGSYVGAFCRPLGAFGSYVGAGELPGTLSVGKGDCEAGMSGGDCKAGMSGGGCEVGMFGGGWGSP